MGAFQAALTGVGEQFLEVRNPTQFCRYMLALRGKP